MQFWTIREKLTRGSFSHSFLALKARIKFCPEKEKYLTLILILWFGKNIFSCKFSHVKLRFMLNLADLYPTLLSDIIINGKWETEMHLELNSFKGRDLTDICPSQKMTISSEIEMKKSIFFLAPSETGWSWRIVRATILVASPSIFGTFHSSCNSSGSRGNH